MLYININIVNVFSTVSGTQVIFNWINEINDKFWSQVNNTFGQNLKNDVLLRSLTKSKKRFEAKIIIKIDCSLNIWWILAKHVIESWVQFGIRNIQFKICPTCESNLNISLINNVSLISVISSNTKSLKVLNRSSIWHLFCGLSPENMTSSWPQIINGFILELESIYKCNWVGLNYSLNAKTE